MELTTQQVQHMQKEFCTAVLVLFLLSLEVEEGGFGLEQQVEAAFSMAEQEDLAVSRLVQ